MKKIIFLIVIIVASCGTPDNMKTDNIKTVGNFDLNRYTGLWYEIARLPNSFEKDLTNITAEYSLLENGEISVINRGFDTTSNKWKDANGRAYVPDESNPSFLKVSFFWIFYAPYKVIDLDKDYQWSMVTSSSKRYFWILARDKKMDDLLLDSLIAKAADLGFDTEQIIKVKHDK